MTHPSRITARTYWTLVGQSFETLSAMIAMAKAKELIEVGHECGHQFTVTVSLTGHSSGVVSDDPPVHSDANWSDTMRPVTVRAHSLRQAMLVAAALPITAWADDEDDAQHKAQIGGTE